jgi:hypothetical protein
MKWRFCASLAAAAVIAALGVALQAVAEEDDPTVHIVLHPAAAPRPALKYQLLPPLIDRRPGNAVVQYLKLPHEQYGLYSNDKFWDTICRWAELPLSELEKDLEKEKSHCDFVTSPFANSSFLGFLERGARCESADWDIPIREHEFWTILLPDIQATRAGARILAPRARIQILRRQYDDAIHTLQVGYAFGRHVGSHGVCLVQCLVGCTIVNQMSKQLETLIQQPNAPNLYWALASLPHPLIDFREAFEAEMAAIELSYPDLRDLEKKHLSAAEWQHLLEQTTQRLISLVGTKSSAGTAAGFTVSMLEGYPRAKQALIADGHSAEEVEAMPVPQVIMLYTMQTYKELRDDLVKWTWQPYPIAAKGMGSADENLRQAALAGREIIPIAAFLLPALVAAKTAEARTDQNIAALQILEALRLYAASHNGRLPDSLKDITEVPIPIDPVRGEPFVYHLDGRGAILESPTSRSNLRLRYEIELKQKGEKP